MSQATGIEWTDATWNPVRGCSRVSEGCRNCYAERVAARFSGSSAKGILESASRPQKLGDTSPSFAGFAHQTKAGPRWTGRVELVPEKLDEPLRWKKPRRIFVNSMSDLFHERLSDEAIAAVFARMAAAQQHTFQVLTKRPERMRAWVDGPGSELAFAAGEQLATEKQWCHAHEGEAWPLPNVWLGVSVEDQATADERIPLLLQTPAAVRFVSYEPALGQVDFSQWFIAARLGQVLSDATPPEHRSLPRPSLDWLIVGGESGPGARPFHFAWARSARDECRAAGAAFFFKQAGSSPFSAEDHITHRSYDGRFGPLPQGFSRYLNDRKGGDMSEWPEDLRVREFPEASGAA